MKELSIEEKAQRYDEAIKRVENIKTGKCETTFMFTEGLLEHIFPELAESEDERMMKKIIATIHLYYGEPLEDEAKEMIAWLEKQGKQKPEQKFFINDKVVHEATGKIWTIHHYLKDTNSYYVEDNDGLLHHYRESELKLVEKKPAEWSEDDYNEIEIIACHLDNINNEGMAEALRSIRDKYYLQNTWKPSDKQIEAVRIAAEIGTANNSWAMGILKSIYQDLKKLKG